MKKDDLAYAYAEAELASASKCCDSCRNAYINSNMTEHNIKAFLAGWSAAHPCKHSIGSSKSDKEPWRLGPELVCGKCGVHLKPPETWEAVDEKSK